MSLLDDLKKKGGLKEVIVDSKVLGKPVKLREMTVRYRSLYFIAMRERNPDNYFELDKIEKAKYNELPELVVALSLVDDKDDKNLIEKLSVEKVIELVSNCPSLVEELFEPADKLSLITVPQVKEVKKSSAKNTD